YELDLHGPTGNIRRLAQITAGDEVDGPRSQRGTFGRGGEGVCHHRPFSTGHRSTGVDSDQVSRARATRAAVFVTRARSVESGQHALQSRERFGVRFGDRHAPAPDRTAGQPMYGTHARG